MSEALPLLLVALVLVPLAGLFTAVDAALNSVSAARLAELEREDEPGAARLHTLLGDRARYVNILVLLRLACEVTATVLVAVVVARELSLTPAVLLSAGVMLVVTFVAVGVGPRTLGRQHSYRVALAAAAPLQVAGVLLSPVSRLLIVLGNALTPGKGFREGPFSSEVELRELVDLAQQGGVVADDERRMIQSVFELGDTTAREVMVPRTDVVWIEHDKTSRQAMSLAVRSGHSRIPVVGENVDDVLGVVYLKDLVQHSFTLRRADRGAPVSELMRPAVFVPDSKRLDALLREMQRDHNHMAVLVDEYGGVAGVVTIEDVLEEIVGEIVDEYDTDERAPVEHLEDGAVRVAARLSVDDLGELFDLELDDSDVETVSGLLGQALGRVPLPGSEVTAHGLVMRAEGGQDPRGRVRVETVLVRAVPAPPDPDAAAEAAGPATGSPAADPDGPDRETVGADDRSTP
ncbi:hemolysin family protein [Rhodococcus aerolatus]